MWVLHHLDKLLPAESCPHACCSCQTWSLLQVYYYNTLTNESSWEKPEDYVGDASKASAQLTPVSTQAVKGTQWAEVVCADGRRYYFNATTQVCGFICSSPVVALKHVLEGNCSRNTHSPGATAE